MRLQNYLKISVYQSEVNHIKRTMRGHTHTHTGIHIHIHICTGIHMHIKREGREMEIYYKELAYTIVEAG